MRKMLRTSGAGARGKQMGVAQPEGQGVHRGTVGVGWGVRGTLRHLRGVRWASEWLGDEMSIECGVLEASAWPPEDPDSEISLHLRTAGFRRTI